VLSQLRVEQELKNFVKVRLYTDRVPVGTTQVPDAQGARDFRDEKLRNYALPFYVVLKPVTSKKLRKVAFYDKPVIGSPEEFNGFLQRALAASRKGTSSSP